MWSRLAAVLLTCLGLFCLALQPKAQIPLTGAGVAGSAVTCASGVECYYPVGLFTYLANATTVNTSVNIGAAASDRFVIIGECHQSAQNPTTAISVNGTGLSSVITSGTSTSIWAGLVTSGSGVQTVAVTYTAGSLGAAQSFFMWIAYTLNSTTVEQTGSGNPNNTGFTIASTNASDFVFTANCSGGSITITDPQSSAPPSHVFSVQGFGTYADWLNPGAHTPFTIAGTGASTGAAASWH